MKSFFGRYANPVVLVGVLFAQAIGLGVQVRRTTPDRGSVRLVRYWAIIAVTPFEKAYVGTQHWLNDTWRNYFYLRDVRRENDQLRQQIQHMQLEQVRLKEDAEQARRLQLLLGFKEQFISQTMAAQVIGSSGSEQSRVIYIDKGSHNGIKADMSVVTPEGVVGKVLSVWPRLSQVLEINDQSSGVGVILEKSRLQGILRGTANGEAMLNYVMSDEKVEPGERVLTSGGDRIFPKGLPIGTVMSVAPGNSLFLNIRVKPSAPLDRLEEVLVITRIEEKSPDASEPNGPVRAIDILAQRLPTVPPKPDAAATPAKPGAPATATQPKPATGTAATAKPATTTTPKPDTTAKPGGGVATPNAPAATGSAPPKPAKKPAETSPDATAPAASKPPKPATETPDASPPDTTKDTPR